MILYILYLLDTAVVLSVVTYALPCLLEIKPALIVYFGKLLGVDFVATPLVLMSSYRLEIKNYFVRCQMIDTAYMHCSPKT